MNFLKKRGITNEEESKKDEGGDKSRKESRS